MIIYFPKQKFELRIELVYILNFFSNGWLYKRQLNPTISFELLHVVVIEIYDENPASCRCVFGKRRNIFAGQCDHCSLIGHWNQTVAVSLRLTGVWNVSPNLWTPCSFHWTLLPLECIWCPPVVWVTWKYWCPGACTASICWHVSFKNIAKPGLSSVPPVPLG